MDISQADWIAYKDKLSAISDTAAEKFEKWLTWKGGYQNISKKEMINMAYALSTKYGEAAASLAAQMYDETAALSGVTVPAAEVANTASYGEIAKAINGVTKTLTTDKNISNIVARHTKMAGADTTLKNAARDGAEFAWIPAGDTCIFCLEIASNGWRHISAKSMKNGHAEHIHANCDCTYSVRFDGKSNVKGYHPEKYKEMFKNAEGDTPQEKVNFLRRIQYQENKDKINAQKRANYALNNADKMYRKINRVKAPDGHQIIDNRTYKKITKDFLKHDGIIIRGEKAAKHLEDKGYAAYLPGFNVAIIRDDATVSDVLEEMYHAYQDRIKMFGESTVEREVLLRREIDAQKYLLRMKKRYKIPVEETNLTKENLKYYEEQLKQLLEGRTSG